MVIGKSAEVYEKLFTYYRRVAAANGLVRPPVGRAPAIGNFPATELASFVLATMDFKKVQHQGSFRGVARVFGEQPSNHHRRVVGRGVHVKRFWLAPWGDHQRDPFFSRMVHLRETESDLDIEQLRCKLVEMTSTY